MRADVLVSEIGIGLRRNLTMTIAVIVTVAASLSFVGMALLLRKEAAINKDYWYDKVEVSIFLCGDGSKEPSCAGGPVTSEQAMSIEADLRGLSHVETVYYESKYQAYERSRDLPGLQAFTESVTPEQMPESFRVKLHDPDQSDVVVNAFRGRTGVDTVLDQKRLLAPLFSLLDKMQFMSLAFALVQLATAGLMIMNTIRLAAFNRRRETGIMKLVGASSFSIQLPFLLEGAIAGFAGAVLAGGAVLLGYKITVVDWLAIQLPMFRYIDWDDVWATIPLLLVIGIVVAALASLITLRKHLRV
jgi:cell division transport system permease protein